MKKKYIIRLSAEERQNLTDLVRKGKVAAYRRTHAQILLFTDEGELGPGLQDKEAAERVGVNHRTVWAELAEDALPMHGQGSGYGGYSMLNSIRLFQIERLLERLASKTGWSV